MCGFLVFINTCFMYYLLNTFLTCRRQRGRVLKHGVRDRHSLGSKPTRAILLCPWERHFTALSPAWWSWQAVVNKSHISIKISSGQQYFGTSSSRSENCLSTYIVCLRRFPASQEDKYRDKNQSKNKKTFP